MLKVQVQFGKFKKFSQFDSGQFVEEHEMALEIGAVI